MTKAHTPDELAFIEAQLRDIVTHYRFEWEDADSELHEPRKWFSQLRLISSHIDEEEAAIFLFEDKDGQRYGYRWPIPEDTLTNVGHRPALFGVHLAEDVDGCELEVGEEHRGSPPDGDGVSWFGDVPLRQSRGGMLGFLALLHDTVAEYRRKWAESGSEVERWFSGLEDGACTIERNTAIFHFTDEEGRWYGYRWRIPDNVMADPPKALRLFTTDLQEHLNRYSGVQPDDDGVRWL